MKKRTIHEFVTNATRVHNRKYIYSNVEYVTNKTPVKIKCPEHGIFFQSPNNHINKKQGCPVCSGNAPGSTESFISKANKIHNNTYDYSKVNYVNSKTKVIITCPVHGDFSQSPDIHVSSPNYCGCPECGGTTKSNTNKFILSAIKVHQDKYDYSYVRYKTAHKPVKIYCKKCHKIFIQCPTNHLNGRGCYRCQQSHGENVIEKFLNNNSIHFISQKRFPKCKNPKTNYELKYDFYIPSKNMLIEYDGEQHFKIGRLGSYIQTKKELDNIQYRDQIKTTYATKNNIFLLRIKYTDFFNINLILSKNL
jgi:Zn finger protein HypA/HybF involved in hydrogenase expression